MISNKGKFHTFQIDFKSEVDGSRYQGNFMIRKLSILDQAKISRRKSELCGGMYCVRDKDDKPTGQGIDEWTEWLNHMIALLETSIETAPQWWNLEEIYDESLLVAVFGEVMSYENSFRRRPGEDDKGGVDSGRGEGDSEEQRPQPNDALNAPKVVDGQVQAALDA